MRTKSKLLSVVLMGALVLTLCLVFGPVRADTQAGSGIIFGRSHKYSAGMTPSVSMCNGGIYFVEVHKAQSTIVHHDYLWYGVGNETIHNDEYGFSIEGGFHHYASGYEPTVSVGSDGTVVAIHRDSSYWTYYQVGRLDYNTYEVDWGPIHQFGGKAYRPIVAVNGKGQVVEAYKWDNNTFFYRVGKVDIAGRTIDWGDSVDMTPILPFDPYVIDPGPSIDIDDDGIVIMSSVGKGWPKPEDTCLLYCAGTMIDENKTIDIQGFAGGYRTDKNISIPTNVDLNNQNEFMAVFEVDDSLYYQVGTIRVYPEKDFISMSVSGWPTQYDKGVCPDIGLNDGGMFVEVHKSQHNDELYAHAGTLHHDIQPTNRDWGTASAGARETANEWYLAEGCTAPGFETWVLVQNPGTEDANVNITYMTPEGQVNGPSQTVRAGTRATFNVAETVGNSWEVSTRVDSDKPVVAERAMYGSGRTWATNSPGVAGGSDNWMLAEGCTAPGFETWVLVQNPGTEDANVHLTYMTDNGVVEGPSRVVKAGTRATFNAAETVGSVWEVSTRVTSDRPMVAERAMYGSGHTWGTNSAGVTEPSTDWFLAEGCTGAGFETWILIQNPGAEDADVNLTYMTSDGTTRTTAAVVKARTRASFNAEDTAGSAWELSTRITSDEPVVAERAMYGNGRTWASGSAGMPQAGTEWYLAEGCTAPGFETWVLVQNPGAEDADVEITYMTQDGVVESPSVIVKAGSRTTLNVSQTVGGAFHVSTKVDSNKPIVVERAMYGNDL